jgi:hemolysin D
VAVRTGASEGLRGRWGSGCRENWGGWGWWGWQRLVEQRQELPALASHRDGALAAQAAFREQRAETEAEYEKSLLDDLRKAQDQASAIAAEFTKADGKLTLDSLKAPIDGTVQQLAVHTIGGVVTPAQGLLILVPDQDGLVAEVEIANGDVGFVREGQRAEIKVETFAFTRYGLLEGQVVSISRDVVSDGAKESRGKDGQPDPKIAEAEAPRPSYVARIALSRDWMKTEDGQVPLGPGMAVTAEIQTGRRRILDFLLSPIVRRIQESGHER